MRFLVHTFVAYDGRLDVEEYIDEGAITLAQEGNEERDSKTLQQTFNLLNQAAGGNALRRFDGEKYTGKFGLAALEAIAVGIARNLDLIVNRDASLDFVRHKLLSFWAEPAIATFTSPGLRGTTRIQRTVPFGLKWFKP